MQTSRPEQRRVKKSLRKIKIIPTDFKLTAATGPQLPLTSVLISRNEDGLSERTFWWKISNYLVACNYHNSDWLISCNTNHY